MNARVPDLIFKTHETSCPVNKKHSLKHILKTKTIDVVIFHEPTFSEVFKYTV
jgi:hypothetical protein